jgi:hypothetical protein
MSRNLIAVTGVTVLLGLALACTSNSSTPLAPTTPTTGGASGTASDGSTLKVTAPVAQSPTGGVKPSTGPATLVVGAATAPFTATPALQYRFQVFNAANAMVENVLVNGTNHPVDAELTVNASYSWQARAEYQGFVGPWSAKASFIAPESAFLKGNQFADPLTNGRTVGVQHGGTFIAGQGWQSLSHSDGIDYDLDTPCFDNCRLEFDATNFGPQEGEPDLKDVKWVSMGDAADFGSFGAFRDGLWKMHLVQRADYPTGIEIVWRNGLNSPDTDPGDHRIKLNQTDVVFHSSSVYHFQLDWSTAGYTIAVNGAVVMTDGWGRPYAPPHMRVSLGCYPRGESFIGTIYRNIKLKQF